MIKKINRPKHLYIHIPFCKNICHYCDFVRFVTNKKTQQKYIKKIILELNELPKNYFKTIYIGGGTPNCLDNILLSLLLKTCKKLLEKKYEFTIECNPEFVDQKQVNIFNTYNINRISIGAQTTNNLILKKYNRKHSFDDVVNAIKILRLNNIDNINLDFIYGFNELKKTDIVNVIKFVKKNKIPHVSFYALELKENSFISKNKIFLSDEKIDDELKLIVSLFKKNNYHRYEVSS
jgi:oxygen-independent coproporphyrinogen-3 oxidase